MDQLDLLAVQGTLKSLLQHHSSKASILRRSAFFIVQLSHPYMTTGKTTALTRRTFVGKVMSLIFNMLSRLVITFLPRSGFFTMSQIYLCLSNNPTWELWPEWVNGSPFDCLPSNHSLHPFYQQYSNFIYFPNSQVLELGLCSLLTPREE